MAGRITEMITAATERARMLAISQGKAEVVERFDRVHDLAEGLIDTVNKPEEDNLFLEVIHTLDRREAMDLIMLLANEVSMRRRAEEIHGV